MNKEDYFLTGGDPKFWRVVDEQKRYGGQLTIQVWHPPVKSVPLDDELVVTKVEKKIASLSGSAESELYGSSTETVIDSSSSVASGSSVKTVSGKSEKIDD